MSHFPEIDKWQLSEFLSKKVIPAIGFKPYPLDELVMMSTALCVLRQGFVFEWGTHLGISARVFYETAKYFHLDVRIFSIDLPVEAAHPENIKNNRARFLKNISEVELLTGDGISVALKIIEEQKLTGKILFYLDGDHFYRSINRELRTVWDKIPQADILIHDTFYRPVGSLCRNGPFRAVSRFYRSHQRQYLKISVDSGLPGMTWLHKVR